MCDSNYYIHFFSCENLNIHPLAPQSAYLNIHPLAPQSAYLSIHPMAPQSAYTVNCL